MDGAKQEIDRSLLLSKFCMRRIGLNFESNKGPTKWSQKLMFMISVCSICYHVFSEIVYIGLTLSNSPKVEEVVPLFHTFGYGFLSIAKVFVLWYKKDVFIKLIEELDGIWPVPPLNAESQMLKDNSLAALRLAHQYCRHGGKCPGCQYAPGFCRMQDGLCEPLRNEQAVTGYFAINVVGVWFYNVTPIAVYFYQLYHGEEAQVGYVWVSWYPFDKHEPIAHVAVYIFEMFAGQTCVWIMTGTDLLFSAMASHICLLLQILRKRLEALATVDGNDDQYYEEILVNIKLHQRLITYCNDIEEAFSFSNLINIIMSSINICCVVFVIVLLDPFMAISNKLFMGSALLQIGVLCWYGDALMHANADIAISAYNSGWYRTSPRCRKALMFLIVRAQKPIAFTAWKITNMSLVTYSSILTRSYSYFALLYTMYSES